MVTGSGWRMGATVAGVAVLAGLALSSGAQQPAGQIDNDDIGGVVIGPNGPEAGVWVIAETRDLPTRFARSVVTDDQGRYVVPACPRPATASGYAATGWSIQPR